MSACEKCGGDGFYFDPVCMKDDCAHGGRKYSWEERKKLMKEAENEAKGEKVEDVPHRKPRVMPCPPRPCSCPAGAVERAELREKIQRQEEMIKGTGTWLEVTR